MKIIIYEDNVADLQILMEHITTFFAKKDINTKIIICSEEKEIYEKSISADLIFLDIEGLDANGIDIGIKIREINADAKIIFTSNYSKYLIDGYKAMASRYFLKPIKKEMFEIEFESVVGDYLLNNAGFTDTTIFKGKLYYKNIMYVEFRDRKTYLALTSGKMIETNYPLKYWLEKLSSYFFSQPYKAFIVNLRQISSITSNEVILHNNEKIPLSRSYKKQFEKDHLESIRRRIWLW